MRRGVAFLPVCALLVACAPDASDAGVGSGTAAVPTPERADSADVHIVATPGPDRPLGWRAVEVLRLGPTDEGPEAFFRVDEDGSGFGSDDAGNLYVLDTGHAEVRVFGSDGRHLRTLARPGEGPGELVSPTRLFVSGDGVAAVADSRKRALVRFGPDGSVLPAITLPHLSFASFDLRGAAQGLVFTFDDPYETLEQAMAREPRTTRLTVLPVDWAGPAPEPGRARELATWTETPDRGYRIEACDAEVSFPRPLRPSQVVATAAGEWLAWAVGPEYAVDIARPDGSRSSVRRALDPVTATRELAIRDFRPRSIELPSHEMCEIDGERAVDAAGFGAVVPWISDVRIALDGQLFVQRRDAADLPTRRIDVFASGGGYVGTLPADFPFPARFVGADAFLRMERDDLDRPTVVLYRIERP